MSAAKDNGTEAAKDAQDMARCCANRDKTESRSMVIQFLTDNLKKNGCEIPGSYNEFIKCFKCPTATAGAFGLNVDEVEDLQGAMSSNTRRGGWLGKVSEQTNERSERGF